MRTSVALARALMASSLATKDIVGYRPAHKARGHAIAAPPKHVRVGRMVAPPNVTVVTHDRAMQLASSIATHDARPTRKNRRKLAIAKRRASVRAR